MPVVNSGSMAATTPRRGVGGVKKMFKPKGLKGKAKQTEGFTPREAMPEGKKAGKFGARTAKLREKRLEKEPM